jgi:hypothetical protein
MWKIEIAFSEVNLQGSATDRNVFRINYGLAPGWLHGA